MAISIDEVNRIADLSRLSFSDDEKQKFTQELSKILDYVGQVQEISEKSAEEHFYDESGVNLMRDDVAEPVTDPKEFLAQAPSRQDKFLKVKSILE